MFTLKKDIPQLYQWDSNVKLIVEDDKINQVQFSQRFSQTAVCVKVENKECFIPNEFLQSYYDIFAYACIVDNDGQVCEFSDMFSVFARPKPDNYVYTPTEILTLKHIEDELNKKFEALAKEIEDDMETAVRTRPQELTEEEKSQARKNIGAISSEEDRGAYYVTITEDESGYVSDRTFDDISYALNNNLFPYAKYDLNVYPLISSSDGTLTFGGGLSQSFTEIKIMPDNSVSINNHNYSPDWEAQEYDDGFIKNRTHGKIIYKCDTEEKVPTSISGARELTDAQETYLQSIGANTKSSKELSFVLPGYDVSYDRMSNEYDYDNYEPPNESNTKIQIAIQDSSGIMTAMPSFTVSEIKANDILYGWSFNFTDGGFAENYLKCIVMLLKHVPYNGYIRKGIWLPNYTGSPKKGYACKIEYTCIKKLEKTYIPDLGNSLPDGGTTGQVLTKNSNADGDAGWKEPYTYVLPAATAETLGGVKIGDGINIAEDGTISSEGSGSASAVLYTEQTLTDEQKTQALANIGGLSKNQGIDNSGKFLGIGADGIVVPTEVNKQWKLMFEHIVTDEDVTNKVAQFQYFDDSIDAEDVMIIIDWKTQSNSNLIIMASNKGSNWNYIANIVNEFGVRNNQKDVWHIHCEKISDDLRILEYSRRLGATGNENSDFNSGRLSGSESKRVANAPVNGVLIKAYSWAKIGETPVEYGLLAGTDIKVFWR